MKFLLSHSHSDTKTLLGVFTQSGAQNDVEQTSELCCIAVYQQVPVISRPI